MLIMLYQAKKLMASLGFAACLQELLSDRRARYLLNFLTTFACENLICLFFLQISALNLKYPNL